MHPVSILRRLMRLTPNRSRLLVGAALTGLALIGGLNAPPAQAQAINARWTGVWQNDHGADKLVISERQFAIGNATCRWSTTVPRQVKQCLAYYEGTITRTQIQQALDESEKYTQNMLRQGADPKTARAIQEQFRRNRQIIARISNDTFKLIQTLSPDKEMGSGDCGDVYFLDKESVYHLAQCAPAPEAFTLTAFRKVN